MTFEFVGSFYLVFWIVSHGFIFPWDDAGIHSIFEAAGGDRSLHGCRQRSSMQLSRISRLITVTYLRTILIYSEWHAAKPRTALPTYSTSCTAVAICFIWSCNFSLSFSQNEHETHCWLRCSKGFKITGWYGDDSDHGFRIIFFWSTSLLSLFFDGVSTTTSS